MRKFLTVLFVLFTITSLQAQNAIKKVIVETYYISDNDDASDTIGGILEPGSVTYRVFIQMQPGYALQKIYGDVNHPLIFESTASFFNNKDRGQSFGKDINDRYLKENTFGLDTWLTIGQATKTNNGITNFGVLKTQDSNGSIIGGEKNDGGSSEIESGLLKNNDLLAGIPLTDADGLDTLDAIPENWLDIGFRDFISGQDTTIFGSIKKGDQFESYQASLENSGVMGVNPDSNQVLVAQLTTKGELSFELNVALKDSMGAITYYVTRGVSLADTFVKPFLKYPYTPECGCTNTDYIEFNPEYLCSNSDSCKTKIILGCTDINACNYDPTANRNVQSVCCYPGQCGGRDLGLVCPDMVAQPLRIKVYPNPGQEQVAIQVSEIDTKQTKYVVFNSFGVIVFTKDLGIISGTTTDFLEVSDFNPGIYLVRLIAGDSGVSVTFVKN